MDDSERHVTIGTEPFGAEVRLQGGNPDLGLMQIVKHSDSDIARLDLTGAHNVPYMSYTTPKADVADYHVVLEGSLTLANPDQAGVDVQIPRDPTFVDRGDDEVELSRVLTSAMEQQPLSLLHLFWSSIEDRCFNGGSNNRGGAYARALIPAALELIRIGLIGVIVTRPEPRLLERHDAMEVNNWWHYKPIPDLDDPLEVGPSETEITAPPTWVSYHLLAQVNRHRFANSAWPWPPRMAYDPLRGIERRKLRLLA